MFCLILQHRCKRPSVSQIPVQNEWSLLMSCKTACGLSLSSLNTCGMVSRTQIRITNSVECSLKGAYILQTCLAPSVASCVLLSHSIAYKYQTRECLLRRIMLLGSISSQNNIKMMFKYRVAQCNSSCRPILTAYFKTYENVPFGKKY